MVESTCVCAICQKVFKPKKETSRYCSRKCFYISGSGKIINTPEIFWSKVDKTAGPDGCWIWKGGLNPAGYGKLNFHNKPVLAHRHAWELTNGAIPEGLICCHKCDMRNCLNPAHIFLGTYLDNTKDRQNKGRVNVYSGEKSPNAKLTYEQVSEIRRLYSDGSHSSRSLSKEFLITRTQIMKIVKNKSWVIDSTDLSFQGMPPS